MKSSIEKRQKNYPKDPARCVTIGLSDVREENPSSDAPPHSLLPVHLSGSNDSKAQEELGFNESKQSLLSESKDTVGDNAGLMFKRRTPSSKREQI